MQLCIMNALPNLGNPKFQLAVDRLSTPQGPPASSSNLSLSKSRLSDPGNGSPCQSDLLRKQSKASVTQIRLHETIINVEPTMAASANKVRKLWRKRVSNEEDYMKSIPPKRIRHPMDENIFVSFACDTISALLKLAICLPCSLILMLLTPLALLVKAMLCVFCYCTFPLRRGDMLTPHCGQFFLKESDSVIQSVLVIDGHISIRQLRRVVGVRMIHSYPFSGPLFRKKLTHSVKFHLGQPTWNLVEDFDIENHIIEGPRIENEFHLQQYVSELLSKPLPLTKPLWEIILINNYKGTHECVLVFRVHPCVGDGISLMRALCQCLKGTLGVIPSKTHTGGLTFCSGLMGAIIVWPWNLFKIIFCSKHDKNILTLQRKSPEIHPRKRSRCSRRGKIGECHDTSSSLSSEGKAAYTVEHPEDTSGYFVMWSNEITMETIDRLKQITKTTVNAIVLAALSGALRSTFQKLGIDNPPDVKVSVAVDLRDDSIRPKGLYVKSSHVSIKLPVNVIGTIPRIWKVREELDVKKASSEAVATYGTLWWVYKCLPRSWAANIVSRLHNSTSLEYSSLPGDAEQTIMCGHRVKELYTMKTPVEPLSFSVSLVTYSGKVYVTLIAKRSIKRCAWFTKTVLKEMYNQCEEGKEIVKQRRLPSELVRREISHKSIELRKQLDQLKAKAASYRSDLDLYSKQHECLIKYLSRHKPYVPGQHGPITLPILNDTEQAFVNNDSRINDFLRELDESTDIVSVHHHKIAFYLEQVTSQTIRDLRDCLSKLSSAIRRLTSDLDDIVSPSGSSKVTSQWREPTYRWPPKRQRKRRLRR